MFDAVFEVLFEKFGMSFGWVLLVGFFLLFLAFLFRIWQLGKSNVTFSEDAEGLSEFPDHILDQLQGPFPKRDQEKILRTCEELGLKHELFFDQEGFQQALEEMKLSTLDFSRSRLSSFDPGVIFVKLATKDPQAIKEFRAKLGIIQ